MKPSTFVYRRPDTVAAALDVLADAGPDVAVLAGGQSLVRLMNMRIARPAVVIDINRVPGLDDVEVTPDVLRIGAMVRVARLEHDPRLSHRLPVLTEVAGLIGHPQIRSRATVGGSLCHADPAAELPTLAVTLGARLRLRSASGDRVVAAGDFYRRPQVTIRQPGELLTEIEIPVPRGLTARFVEISRRSNDLPLVGVCAAVVVEDGMITWARVGAGGIAPVPVRLPTAEQMLTGRTLAELTSAESAGSPLRQVLAAAANEADPPDDPEASPSFRRGLLRSALRRAVIRLAAEEAAR